MLIRPQDAMDLPAQSDHADFGYARRADVGAFPRGGRQPQAHFGGAWRYGGAQLAIIPGNEKLIFRMIDHLARRGADLMYGNMNPPLHVSGHASMEELRLVLNLVRPRYFVPIHGEYWQMSKHARLASI